MGRCWSEVARTARTWSVCMPQERRLSSDRLDDHGSACFNRPRSCPTGEFSWLVGQQNASGSNMAPKSGASTATGPMDSPPSGIPHSPAKRCVSIAGGEVPGQHMTEITFDSARSCITPRRCPFSLNYRHGELSRLGYPDSAPRRSRAGRWGPRKGVSGRPAGKTAYLGRVVLPGGDGSSSGTGLMASTT